MATKRPIRAADAVSRTPGSILDGPRVLDAPRPEDATGRKNLLQLVQLRWIAVGGQIATIAAAILLFHVALPLGPMAAVLVTLSALNLASRVRLRAAAAVTDGELLAALTFDVAALTVQLYLSGGATNPFVSLYLLQITLGAVLLEPRSSVVLAVIAAAAYAGLVGFHQPLNLPVSDAERLQLHLDGALVAFLLDAVLLVVFVTRIGRNLRARDARLADLRQQAAEEDHIVRMGLLASGAAHELGTPLSTLSVILNDWRRAPGLAGDPERLAEIADMEAEVRRCKAIVTGILLSAGEARGEAPRATTAKAFLDAVVADWRSSRAEPLVYANTLDPALRIVSDEALKQVLSTVLDNAAEASPSGLSLGVRREDGDLVLTVTDDGPGFAPQVLTDFGRPYNSTKGRAGGGLGLFLVVNVVRKLGGGVAARNRPQGGAAVVVTLPLAALGWEGRDD